jgi:hypothetical protein
MKSHTLIVALVISLTGCAGYQNWTPIQEVKTSSGGTFYWIRPLPATANGEQGIGGRSAEVTTRTGTVNGRGYSVSSFK